MLAKRIAALRKEKGWNQAALAQRLGVSPSAIGMYEQGRREPDCKTLVALAQVLDSSVSYLVTGKADHPRCSELENAFAEFSQKAQAQLVLRSADGTERPFGSEELALLLAALEA